MSEDLPAEIARALADHDAFVAAADGHRVTTTVFDATLAVAEPTASPPRYRVTVTVPSLEAATSDPVGQAVADGWFETFERRLDDAPTATRAGVDLDDVSVERDGLDVVVTYTFGWADAAGAVAIAKTLVEYVEGTYVEGVIPGYEYEPPVADLLSAAETGGDARRGGTPL